MRCKTVGSGKIETVVARWILVWSLWFGTSLGAWLVVSYAPHDHALEWFGALLAGSVASVAQVHLIKARPEGFVRELIYVAGGSYLILALTSIMIFIRG